MLRFKISAIATAITLCLSACGEPLPSANVAEWNFVRNKDGKGYTLTAKATLGHGKKGWFSPTVVMRDERGCLRTEYLGGIHPISSPNPERVEANISKVIDYKYKVATVQFSIMHQQGTDPAALEEQRVYSAEKTIDASLSPPDMPAQPCSETKAGKKQRLREKAKTDPKGADAEAVADMSRNELLATAINSAGFLCAKVTDMYPRGGDIVVHCVEYRSGSGRAKYLVRPSAGQVERLD